MNSRARLAALTLASGLVFVTVACSDDDAPDTVPTTAVPAPTAAPEPTSADTTVLPADIVATALNARAFSTLAGLLIDAGLVDTLRTPGPFTVFAPTDAAFAKVPTETLQAVQSDTALLTTVLTYHVVPGAMKAADLPIGKLMTVAGVELDITRNGDQVLVNGFPIAAADVVATNGIIHVMGDVLVPPS